MRPAGHSRLSAALPRTKSPPELDKTLLGGLGQGVAAPLACASHVSLLTLRRKHVVVHSDDHWNKHNRVVKKVEFNPRKNQLQDAARHRLTPEIVVKRGLPDQQEMLDVVPELNPKCHHPPGMGDAGKALPEYPKADQHDQGIAIVQSLCLDQPGIKQPKQSQGLWPRPVHHVDLIGLDQMFSPMRQHNYHEDLQRTLMPTRVELFGKAWARAWRSTNVGNRRMRNCHYRLPRHFLENVITITLRPMLGQ